MERLLAAVVVMVVPGPALVAMTMLGMAPGVNRRQKGKMRKQTNSMGIEREFER